MRQRLVAIAAAAALSSAALGCRRPTPWFVDVAAAHGIDFRYDTGAADNRHMPKIMGGGVALFDADNDGDLDAYLVNGNDTLPRPVPDAARTDRFFRREADGRYTDATASAGLGDPYFSMGVATGDIDNDGDQDLYVTNFGPDRLYRNDGDGTFTDGTDPSGIDETDWSVGAAFLDYDRDGYLDLFVGDYLVYDPTKECHAANGAPEWCGPASFADRGDLLYHNNGDGTFSDVSARAGIAGTAYSSMGVIVDDYDDDGWPDVYVANDADPGVLWLNQHDGTFVDAALRLGAAVNAQGDPEAGMGIVSDDLDGNGSPDLFVTHLVREKNTLYRNLGAGRGFVDDSVAAGLAKYRTFTAFGTVAIDIELDGDLDLVVVNGRVNGGLGLIDGALPAPPWAELAEPNQVYVNDGRGIFTELDADRCGLCTPVEVSRGLAAGDVDGDGDEDLLLLNANSPARLYENRAPRAGRWLSVRALDPAIKRDALGARVTVYAGGRSWTRTVRSSVSYASAQEPRAHFGLGRVDAIERIEVRWPDGTAETFTGTCLDCRVELRRGQGGSP